MNSKIMLFFLLSVGVLTCLTPNNKHNTAFAQENSSGYPDFSNLAEKMLPTVVNISTKIKVDGKNNQMMFSQNMPEEMMKNLGPLKDLFEQFNQQYGNRDKDKGSQNNEDTEKPYATPKNEMSALGSGFVIDAEKGYIVTNNHVIDGADEIQVTLNDKTTIDAELVGTDTKTDIALLKVKDHKDKLVAAKWGDSDALKVGNWVLAIGNPFGLGGTVTAGIVSARERDINSGPYDDYIQTDASINRGNSGGPMFNMKGEVVGINTAIFSTMGGGSIGIGFAAPSNMTHEVVEQLAKYGTTKRGWLGVSIQPVTEEMAESLGLSKADGAMVADVTKEGPSAKAGIEVGDVILEFDGKQINQMRTLPKMVATTEVGKDVDVLIWHKGEKKTVKVQLGQLEKAEKDGLVEKTPAKKSLSGKTSDDSTNVKELGLNLSPINDNLKNKFHIDKETAGLVVTDVASDSAAADKGIRVGDVIVTFEQQAVKTPSQVEELLTAAKSKGKTSVLLFIERDNDKRFVALKLKEKEEKKTDKK